MKLLLIAVLSVLISGSSHVESPVEYSTYKLDIPEIESHPYRQWNISYPVSQEELGCLALNIYFESRGEEPDGQFAVADIVMHRVNNFGYPNTVCGVVKKGVYPSWSQDMPIKYKCHFTWYCDRKPDNPVDGPAFARAMYVATTVLNDPNYIPVIAYGLYYHADYVNPEWAEGREVIANLGKHLFY